MMMHDKAIGTLEQNIHSLKIVRNSLPPSARKVVEDAIEKLEGCIEIKASTSLANLFRHHGKTFPFAAKSSKSARAKPILLVGFSTHCVEREIAMVGITHNGQIGNYTVEGNRWLMVSISEFKIETRRLIKDQHLHLFAAFGAKHKNRTESVSEELKQMRQMAGLDRPIIDKTSITELVDGLG